MGVKGPHRCTWLHLLTSAELPPTLPTTSRTASPSQVVNKKKVVIRDIDPKAVSTQELYGYVNMATREWKVRGAASSVASCMPGGEAARTHPPFTPSPSPAGRAVVLHDA